MADVTVYVDAVDAMKGITATIRYTRYTEWHFRSWIGLALIRFGLWLTGMSVVVRCED